MKKIVFLSSEEKNIISAYANEAGELWRRVKSRDGSLEKFIGWLERNPNYNHGDKLGRTTVYEFVNNLVALQDGLLTELTFKTACEKAKILIPGATQYLTNSSSEILTGTQWFVYFVYSKKKQIPKIGRAVLEYLQKNEVKLINVPHITSKPYSGKYFHHERIIYFDLDNEDRNKLHIKIECPEGAKQEIALGAYCTYESHHIVTGTLIFQKIQPDIIEAKKNSPELLAFNNKGESKDIFDYLSPAIKKYLSIKNLNYHSVPSEIYTQAELDDDLEDYNPFEDRRRANRFIETSLPTIFLAVPSSSLDKSQSEDADLIEKIKEQLDTDFKNQAIVIEKHTESTQPLNKTPNESLKQLRQVSIFVLIISSVNIASFSLIQLGFAIAHCKRVLVVFKEVKDKKTISERMKSLTSAGVQTIMYGDLKAEFAEKYQRLSDQIREYLRDIS